METESKGAVPRDTPVNVRVLVATALEANLDRHALQRGLEFLDESAESTNGADLGSHVGRRNERRSMHSFAWQRFSMRCRQGCNDCSANETAQKRRLGGDSRCGIRNCYHVACHC